MVPARKSQTGVVSRAVAGSLSALLVLAWLPACSLLPAYSPPVLDYRVELLDDGVRVTMTVAGGPRPRAWVGFGASPLGSDVSARHIADVSARMIDGSPLVARPVGPEAYRIDIDGDEPWVLEYRANIGAPPEEFYHRASSRSAEHLLLVGVDIWARLLPSAAGFELGPAERPLGDVLEANVRFARDSIPRGWVIATPAPEVMPFEFELTEHPARSAFALGPYRFHEVDAGLGLRAAVHSGWNVARDQLITYSRRLIATLTRELGPPPGGPALMIFTPLPPSARPARGVRSAGMVWDRSLLLFAGAHPRLPLDSERVRDMTAIFLGHEMFHLYVPWGLAVTRPLSWLSEGWAEHVGRSAARKALILSTAGADRSLRDAYERYRRMGGARAGSLRNASEFGGEELRPLLYVRGELVFRVLSLEWERSGKPGSFDAALWKGLQREYDGETPLEPEAVSRVLRALVSPLTVRRLVEGAAVITLPELRLGRR